MTSISSIETVTATKQPPVEQDLTPVKNGHPLTADYDDPPPPSQWKGKERQHSYDVSDESDEQNSSEVVDASAYPPTTEDAAESRRIEENLRRWEVAERKRRKDARESISGGPSLVSDVARRASLLWTSQSQQQQPRNVPFTSHNHTKLESQDSLPLESQPNSPTRSAFPQAEHTPTPDSPAENPFSSPSDPQPPSSSQHLQVPKKTSKKQRPQSSKPPPPEPLNLPPPRTPPPRLSVSPPEEDRPQQQLETDEPPSKPTRWWHEILCGCGESGGNQAGRTNPFE